MGITNFFKIPVAKSGHEHEGEPLEVIGEVVDFSLLKGIRVGIDASGIIYNSLTAFDKIATLTDADGNPTGHLLKIIALASMLKKAEINQVWNFDSPKCTPLKSSTNKKRNAKRDAAAAKGDSRNAFKITGPLIEDTKQLLYALGIPVIQAPDGFEAEHYGAQLTKPGPNGAAYYDYFISADSDVIMFGGNLLRYVKEASASGKSKKTVYKIYTQEAVLGALDITYDHLVEVCVTLGTDFQESKVTGVGIKRVVDKVQYGDITFNDNQKQAIEYIKSKVPVSKDDMVVYEPDADKIRAYLSHKKFNEKRIEDVVNLFCDIE